MRNIGLVNCEWAFKGALKRDSEVKIFAEGQTFDGKLYTFKELNYKTEFEHLNIFVKKQDAHEHLSSNSSVSGGQRSSQMQ